MSNLSLQQKVNEYVIKNKIEKHNKVDLTDSSKPDNDFGEIKENVPEEIKLLFEHYKQKSGFLQDNEIYQIFKRFDFNKKLADAHISVLIERSKEIDTGEWIKVDKKPKVLKDEKKEKITKEKDNKKEKKYEKTEYYEEIYEKKPYNYKKKDYYNKNYYESEGYYKNEDYYDYDNYSKAYNNYPKNTNKSRYYEKPYNYDNYHENYNTSYHAKYTPKAAPFEEKPEVIYVPKGTPLEEKEVEKPEKTLEVPKKTEEKFYDSAYTTSPYDYKAKNKTYKPYNNTTYNYYNKGYPKGSRYNDYKTNNSYNRKYEEFEVIEYVPKTAQVVNDDSTTHKRIETPKKAEFNNSKPESHHKQDLTHKQDISVESGKKDNKLDEIAKNPNISLQSLQEKLTESLDIKKPEGKKNEEINKNIPFDTNFISRTHSENTQQNMTQPPIYSQFPGKNINNNNTLGFVNSNNNSSNNANNGNNNQGNQNNNNNNKNQPSNLITMGQLPQGIQLAAPNQNVNNFNLPVLYLMMPNGQQLPVFLTPMQMPQNNVNTDTNPTPFNYVTGIPNKETSPIPMNNMTPPPPQFPYMLNFNPMGNMNPMAMNMNNMMGGSNVQGDMSKNENNMPPKENSQQQTLNSNFYLSNPNNFFPYPNNNNMYYNNK